jgi:hypothetical protein
MSVPFSVIWTDDELAYEKTIATVEEALDLVRHLSEATSTKPAIVDFYIPESGLGLGLGVGRPYTVLTFQYSLDPP